MSFHPSGDYLVTGTEDSNIRLWDVHAIQCFRPYGDGKATHSHDARVNAVQFNAAGSVFGTYLHFKST